MVGTLAFIFSGLLIPLRLLQRATNGGGRTLDRIPASGVNPIWEARESVFGRTKNARALG